MSLIAELLIAVIVIGAIALLAANSRSNSTEDGSAGNDDRQLRQSSSFSEKSNANQHSRKDDARSSVSQTFQNTRKRSSHFDRSGDGTERRKEADSQFRNNNAGGNSTDQRSRLQDDFNIDLSWIKGLEELLKEDETDFVAEADLASECAGISSEDRLRRYGYIYRASENGATRWRLKAKKVEIQIASVKNLMDDSRNRDSSFRVNRATFEQFKEVKNKLQSIISLMNNRKRAFGEQKIMIKDKILDECGPAGKEWLALQEERRKGGGNGRKGTT